MTQLFEILRGEQDNRNLADAPMKVGTGFLATNISNDDQRAMIALKKVDRSRSIELSLREALNKIAHYKYQTFRIDGRGAHYVVLGGELHGKLWVAEFLVSKLCKNATAAIQAITG
ncbi:hypothetical protein LGN13_23590 [Burkholderia multivorans]|uniref:hypothetical protein n=1 Tax=Burkholderia multivorans TaxID=87883 RepID=UPI0009E0CCF2|nr:hypothetical protein [Burkholderia multivorans]MCA8504684.1 hypothetical protein [Burkholderia multivorans]MDN8083274.1 hypothetical protein [Burkholderia multivorans]SAK32457.1 hypothetical protein UA11_01092 [Burkholderia multivorans]